MDLCRAPAGHLSAAMEQNFHRSAHRGLMNLDPWVFAFARHDGRGQALEESEVDMHVEGLSLESSETIGDLTEHLAHRRQVIERFLQMKVREVVAAHFASEESEKLLVLLNKGVLEIGSQDMMTMLDPLQGRVYFALKLLQNALTKELRDFVRGKKKKPQLAGAFKEFSDGKVAFKDEVAAVLVLADRVEARKVHRLSPPLRKFGPKKKPPIVEPLADQIWAQP